MNTVGCFASWECRSSSIQYLCFFCLGPGNAEPGSTSRRSRWVPDMTSWLPPVLSLGQVWPLPVSPAGPVQLHYHCCREVRGCWEQPKDIAALVSWRSTCCPTAMLSSNVSFSTLFLVRGPFVFEWCSAVHLCFFPQDPSSSNILANKDVSTHGQLGSGVIKSPWLKTPAPVIFLWQNAHACHWAV